MLLLTYIKSLGESKQVRRIVVMAVENEEQSLVRLFIYQLVQLIFSNQHSSIGCKKKDLGRVKLIDTVILK